KLFDEAAGAFQSNALGQLLLQPAHRPHRHLVVLVAGAPAEPLSDSSKPVVLDGDDLPALDLGLGPLGVAEVGEEDAGALAADAGAVGAAEAGQVADVDAVGDEQAVELLLGHEGRQPVAASAHGEGLAPSSSARRSSASR